MKWCQLVGFFLRAWKQVQRQFKDDFLDSQGQPRDTWQGFGREQSSCRFRNVTVDVGSLHSGKPRQCLEKNKKTGTYPADCSLLGPSDSSAFLANRLPFPHWIGLALRSATVKVFQGERLMAKNNHLPLGDGSNLVNTDVNSFPGSPRICGRDLRMNLIMTAPKVTCRDVTGMVRIWRIIPHWLHFRHFRA